MSGTYPHAHTGSCALIAHSSHVHMCSHTPAHTCTLQTCSDTCSHTLTRLLYLLRCGLMHIHTYTSAHTCSPHMLTYIHTHIYSHKPSTPAHIRSHAQAPPHVHSLTHTLTQHMQTHIDPSDTPETPIPDGDHIPTVTLDVPAAVGAWGVVEGPGRAVDDATPFCVLFQFPTAGSCQERRLRSTGLTFG